jgi:hypothetical protein
LLADAAALVAHAVEVPDAVKVAQAVLHAKDLSRVVAARDPRRLEMVTLRGTGTGGREHWLPTPSAQLMSVQAELMVPKMPFRRGTRALLGKILPGAVLHPERGVATKLKSEASTTTMGLSAPTDCHVRIPAAPSRCRAISMRRTGARTKKHTSSDAIRVRNAMLGSRAGTEEAGRLANARDRSRSVPVPVFAGAWARHWTGHGDRNDGPGWLC